MKVLYWSLTLLHSTFIRQVLMVSKGRCLMGWKIVVRLKIIALISLNILSFLYIVGTFMSKSLFIFILIIFHNPHFMG